MSLRGKSNGKSIFRKTAIIFVLVTLVPIAILGMRSHHIYYDQLDLMVQSGVISPEAADDQAYQIEIQSITYGGYGLVIALILGYFFASSLVRPIRALQEGARRIGDGDLDFRVETDTDDELADLASTINQMAESLQAREAEIDPPQPRPVDPLRRRPHHGGVPGAERPSGQRPGTKPWRSPVPRPAASCLSRERQTGAGRLP